MAQLDIYKASAGSGKTFQLTGHYINLLFRNPAKYRQILGVTFTNKAADEMKGRILYQIYQLSQGAYSPYFQQIQEELELSDTAIRKRGTTILKNILHDYSRFSISTIDTFFQRIIRSFAREIGLQSSFSIELDTSKVLNEVVDRILYRLQDSPELIKWLTLFSENKIIEGKNWNIKNDMMALGRQIFSEIFMTFDQSASDTLRDKETLNAYRDKLFAIKHHFENTMQKYGREALAILQHYDLQTSDFKYKNAGFANYFNKLALKTDFTPTQRVFNSHNQIENWYSGSSPKKDTIQQVYPELNQKLGEILAFYDQHSRRYYTADHIIKNIFTLGILQDIAEELKAYKSDNNVFLISDNAKLLHEIIAGNEAPFIYEKTGNALKHYMIDEFQDTSTLQWENFKPLITNSLGENYANLIVGDVKQSIYRWRNSDWNILAEQIYRDYPANILQTTSLQYNFRSHSEIIRFNNTLFSQAPVLIQNHINESITQNQWENELNHLHNKVLQAYSDPVQVIPENAQKGGYINLRFPPKEEWKEQVKEELPERIKWLLEHNYRPGDIAILVRKNTEGKEIAEQLLAYTNANDLPSHLQFGIISDDALYLSYASSIRVLIHTLHYLIFPNDEINKKSLANEYYQYILQKTPEQNTLHELYSTESTDTALSFNAIIPEDIISKATLFKQLPLFELTEQLIHLYQLNTIKDEIPYLEAFQDLVNDYSAEYSSDIHSFLNYWEATGKNQTLGLSEEQDAVRIMTIHKSKGLQFKAVIVPFCDWKLTNEQDILWCIPSETPFNMLSVVPVQHNKKLRETIFYQEYMEEHLKSYVDNLNLLYVTFTRAQEIIMAYAPYKDQNASNDHLKTAGELIQACLQYGGKTESAHTMTLQDHWNTETGEFEAGNIPVPLDQEKERDNHFAVCEYHGGELHHTLRLRHHGKDYFAFDEKPDERQVNYGTLMHEILRKIHTEKDLDKAINEVYLDGLISAKEQTDIRQLLQEAIHNKQVKDWFNPQWKILTETDMLLPSGKRIRPDRVLLHHKEAKVIDYKFGMKPDPTHAKQMKEYLKQINKMGYANVSGYLWYVRLNKVENVYLQETEN